MNEDLLQEVSLSVPATTRPETAANPPIVSLPQVSTSQFSVPHSVNVSQSAGQAVDAGFHAEWVTVQALKKPYRGAPLPLVNMSSKGFNVGSSGQDSQARIPQFFNFVESNSGNNTSLVNVVAAPSMKSKSVPDTNPEIECEKGWYISPLDGKKKMTTDNPAFLEQQHAEWERVTQQSTEWERNTEGTSSTISAEEEARIRAELCAVMNQKFGVGRAKLESNPIAQNEALVKLGAATSDVDVIDLISQSVASLQKSQPMIIPGSPISVASTPSRAGNGGSALGFSHLSSGSHPRLRRNRLPQCTGSRKSLRTSLGAVLKMFTLGHLWCTTTSPLWGLVTPSKSPTR